jgi:PAT family beta-lactamase induction signal transducer AmpG
MLSVAVCFIMFVPLALRERQGEKLLPWTAGTASPEAKKMQLTKWAVIFKSLLSAFTLRNSLLLALVTFLVMGACNYIDTLIPIFTVQALHWTDKAYAQFYATATLVGGISGMLIGGILIDRFGKKTMLNLYFLLLILLTSGLVFLKMYWINTWFISGFMIIYQILYVFTCIGLFATAMECCWKKVSATQFTLYMTIGNMGRIVGAKLIGPAKQQFSWEFTLLAFSIAIAIAWVIIQFIHINQQVKRIDDLENKDITDQLMTAPAA